ncbi:hypothetical protein Vadar_017897 [Vaccinium darrowii]|uniref:Uncharacterized protein n=1 Tax=Vaccinium darrowii TaxID=229202 RepID=A0ACB7Z615_9ERIC|nr:hypothetical protein Vadar_017897 [Vaccinium darrowii]
MSSSNSSQEQELDLQTLENYTPAFNLLRSRLVSGPGLGLLLDSVASLLTPATVFGQLLIDDVNFRVSVGHGEALGLGFGSPTGIGSSVSSTSESDESLIGDFSIFEKCDGYCSNGGEEPGGGRSEEFDWEEVDQRVDDRDGLRSVIARFDELSISSEISIAEEGIRAVRDGYVYEAEHETVFGQNESAVLDNLPCLVLRTEDLRENCYLVATLPLGLHCAMVMYSEYVSCLSPFRYELPTDDLDYEQSKTQRESVDMPQDLEMLEFIHGVAES